MDAHMRSNYMAVIVIPIGRNYTLLTLIRLALYVMFFASGKN